MGEWGRNQDHLLKKGEKRKTIIGRLKEIRTPRWEEGKAGTHSRKRKKRNKGFNKSFRHYF